MLILDRAAAFKDDPVFKKAMSDVNSSTGANQYQSPDGIAWRINTLVWAATLALQVPGDFVECGVFHGDMSWVVTETVDMPAHGKAFYLYDTFCGFDARYSSEEDFPEAPQLFKTIDNEYKVQGLFETVRDRFAAKSYVKVIRGAVPDTLGSICPERISFLHMDMNSPAAERAALEMLFDRISRGGIIIFDDYGWILHRKQKAAVDEFMGLRNRRVLELPTGQGLAVFN